MLKWARVSGEGENVKSRFAYKSTDEYEEITGLDVNQAFKIGWDMARMTNEQIGISESHKDHEIAIFVNELKDIATTLGHTQMLRDRIRSCVLKFIK